MRRYVLLFCLFVLIAGCNHQERICEKDVLAKVNNYEISRKEFEQEFKDSSFARTDTLESRKEFLNNLINRKLILQEAERLGLDKQENFLKLIQRFWEQTLLKITLDKKVKEISGAAVVPDFVIQSEYKKMVSNGLTDKSYDEMYQQIKWKLMREKESQILDQWVSEINKKAQIKINESLIGKEACLPAGKGEK